MECKEWIIGRSFERTGAATCVADAELEKLF